MSFRAPVRDLAFSLVEAAGVDVDGSPVDAGGGHGGLLQNFGMIGVSSTVAGSAFESVPLRVSGG